MGFIVTKPFEVFNDLKGDPLENGKLFIGVTNLNPKTDPVPVFFDEALEIPADQPIRTIGGYPSLNGTPANIYIENINYSITVEDKNGDFIYSRLDSDNVSDEVLSRDIISDLTAIKKASLADDQQTLVGGYNTIGDGGGGAFFWDSASTLTENLGTIFESDEGGTGRWIRTIKDATVNVKWFGARGDGTTDDQTAIAAAVTFLFQGNNPGGSLYFPKTKDFYVMSAGIDTISILYAQQGLGSVDAPGKVLPSGDIVRDVTFGIEGDFTSIRTTSGFTNSFLFKIGAFTDFANQQSIKFYTKNIEFVGPGTTGHAATGYGNPVIYTTSADANKGTTNTTSTCLLVENHTPGSYCQETNIRQFNGGLEVVSGFGFEYESGSIQFCNSGLQGGANYTNFNTGASVEIELCGVGFFNEGMTSTYMSGTIIEANVVNILAWLPKAFQLDSVWFEGVVDSDFVFRGDVSSPGLSGRHVVFNSCVGPASIDFNGGVIGFHLNDCFTGGPYTFGVNTGNKFEDVIFEDCTKDVQANGFDVSQLFVSGIISVDDIQVKGRIQKAALVDFGSRDLLTLKGSTSTAIATAQRAFEIVVPNVNCSAKIEIKAHKKSGVTDDMQPQTMHYVGILQRFVGAATGIAFSTGESDTTNYTGLGTNAAVAIAVPTTTTTGAVGATQTIDVEFPTGTAVANNADTMWEVEVSVETGDLTLGR